MSEELASSARSETAFDWLRRISVPLLVALSPWVAGCGEDDPGSGTRSAAASTTVANAAGDMGTATGTTGLGGASSTGSTTGQIQCQPGLTLCGDVCVNLQSASDNCGACGQACEVGRVCALGACSSECVEPFTDCGGVCVELNRDSANCGECASVCEQGKPCVGGVCGCPDGTLFCQGQCIDPNSDAAHCGGCDSPCATGGNCADGACECPVGTTLCGNACVSLTTREHCGSCEFACAANQICAQGTCIADTEPCPPPTERCGSGCVDTNTEPGHCGSCDSPCTSSETCQAGSCGCPEGETQCGESCFDLDDSPLHCGACDEPCTSGQSCVNGSCGCTDASLTACGNECADLDNSIEHCGSCEVACEGGLPCTDGACRCPDGETLCDGVCVNTESEPTHCGACGSACPEGESCIIGQCGGAVGDACTNTLAHGISISEVAVYQAGKIGLMQAGSAIDPAEREVDVVAGKNAIVRVFVGLEAGFTNRVLSARLSLIDGDTVERVFHKRTVDGPTVENSLATSFNIEVDGALITPSTRYLVEVVECGADTGTQFSPRFPATGDEALAARETGILRLEFIPMVVNGIEAATDEARLETYRQYMEAMYPVSAVEMTVGDPLEASSAVSANGNGWEGTLQQLAQRHQNDDAPNDVYYYGLMEPAPTLQQYCGYGCVAGIGYVPESGTYFKDARVSLGISYGGDPQVTAASATTMAHEVGHNHGREHAPCGGAAYAGPFPHDGARIGWWGLFYPDTLVDPDQATDIMGYCENQWVSDFTYQAFLERVVTINGALSWINPNPVGTWEVIVTSTFGSSWGVPPSRAVAAMGTPEAASVIDKAGNEIAQVTVYRAVMDHLSGASIMVPSPEAGWHAIVVVGVPPMVYGSNLQSVP